MLSQLYIDIHQCMTPSWLMVKLTAYCLENSTSIQAPGPGSVPDIVREQG